MRFIVLILAAVGAAALIASAGILIADQVPPKWIVHSGGLALLLLGFATSEATTEMRADSV